MQLVTAAQVTKRGRVSKLAMASSILLGVNCISCRQLHKLTAWFWLTARISKHNVIGCVGGTELATVWGMSYSTVEWDGVLTCSSSQAHKRPLAHFVMLHDSCIQSVPFFSWPIVNHFLACSIRQRLMDKNCYGNIEDETSKLWRGTRMSCCQLCSCGSFKARRLKPKKIWRGISSVRTSSHNNEPSVANFLVGDSDNESWWK